jgi:hypothetical protein
MMSEQNSGQPRLRRHASCDWAGLNRVRGGILKISTTATTGFTDLDGTQPHWGNYARKKYGKHESAMSDLIPTGFPAL